MYQRYTSAGGHAELVAYGAFLSDTPQMLSHREGLAIWIPKMDEFLARLGLPANVVHPEYLPTPVPPASRHAAVNDIAAVPFLSPRGRDLYRMFRNKPSPRAFAIGPDGSAASSAGGYDALHKALVSGGHGVVTCRLYAVNDAVVWSNTSQSQADPLPVHAVTARAGATSTLDFAYCVNPDCTLRALPKIWVSQPPANGGPSWRNARVYPDFPLAACMLFATRPE